jgi:hypothetical protein
LKVVFDENIPAAMLRVFRLFHAERSLKHIVHGVVLESAKDYTPSPLDADHEPKNDVPWIRRYSAAGGKVIISGDTKMTLVPHERLALVQEGMIVVFFAPKWANWPFNRKAALLLHWWPTILRHVRKAKPGFYAVPCAWPEEKAKLRAMQMEDPRLVKMRRQIAETASKREARRVKRETPPPEQTKLFSNEGDENV